MRLKTEADGRMFPVTDSSQTIIDCLMREVTKYCIQILMNREARQLIIDNGQLNSPILKALMQIMSAWLAAVILNLFNLNGLKN